VVIIYVLSFRKIGLNSEMDMAGDKKGRAKETLPRRTKLNTSHLKNASNSQQLRYPALRDSRRFYDIRVYQKPP